MKSEEADILLNKGKHFSEDVLSFMNKRKLNDMVDGRVPYELKPENQKKINKTQYKILKNVFTELKEEEILIKVFKEKFTEMPTTDGNTYGPLELSRCNTPDKLLGQIRYLTGFEWCTKDIVDQFIHVVEAMHISKSGQLLFKSEGR
tara:strand:+ start:315 stop:755 length:441 start_codon:yes stop_codon:yes gene_type:complete